MPTTLQRTNKRRTNKGNLVIDIFKGIDKSTGRHRIFGDGAVLYEAKNVFPYLQGRLQRRKDYVTTNSRQAGAAFPSFPASGHSGADALSGNPVVKKVVEFNDTICILFEDDGDKGKLMMDSFDVGANTNTARIKQSNGITFTADGEVDAVNYSQGTPPAKSLQISGDNSSTKKISTAWAISTPDAQVNFGITEVYLQALFVLQNDGRLSRTAANGSSFAATYILGEDVGTLIALASFGYQTSSAGAFTNLIVWKQTSTWLLTSISTDAVFEQLSGNVGLVGKNAFVNTPFGMIFVGRDKGGKLNLYLLDRVSLTLHTIGHPLYEVLNNTPKGNYKDIFVSYDRNRLIRIALTQAGDINRNQQEYWVDFYNGVKKRTFWGPFPAKVQSLAFAIEFTGGTTPANSGFFVLEESSNAYSIKEEVEDDTYDSSDTDIDDQTIRTKLFDFGQTQALIDNIFVTALDNGAKYKVSREVPAIAPILHLKGGGADASTTITDSSPAPHTVTAAGNAQVDTANTFLDSTGSILFDGTGDWLTIPGTKFDFSGGKWTFDTFVDIDSLASAKGLYSQATDANNYLWIWVDTSGFVNLSIVASGTEVVGLAQSDNALVVNTKYHIRVCEIDDDYYIFVDGKQRATVEDTDRAVSYTSVVYIGANWDGSTANKPYDGHMGNVKVYLDGLADTNFSPPVFGNDRDNDTKISLINSFQMGTTGLYKTQPIRTIPKKRVNQFGIKVDSNTDSTNISPLEISELGFNFTSTERMVIE